MSDQVRSQESPTTSRRLRRAEGLLARHGPWAVVTGASDGIGAASADLLAAAGFDVVLVARRQDVLDRLAVDLRAQHHVDVVVVACDLSSADGVERLFAATTELDVGLLVAAAGFATTGRFVDNDIADEVAMVDLNCRAVVETAHHYGQSFARRGRGGIVMFSSIVAFQGVPNTAIYAATKAFVQSLAEGIRPELKASGVAARTRSTSGPGPCSCPTCSPRSPHGSMHSASPTACASHTRRRRRSRGTKHVSSSRSSPTGTTASLTYPVEAPSDAG